MFEFEIAEWKNLIEIAAIDCVVEENFPLCQKYKVETVPTLKVFSINSQPDDLGLKLDKEYDEVYVRHVIAKQIVKEQEHGNGPAGVDLLIHK